eukprot:COSAG06_NODE_3063_length_5903_cov_3.316334_3_plen_61_part_00
MIAAGGETLAQQDPAGAAAGAGAAAAGCRCLVVRGEDFKSLLGSLDEELERQGSTYVHSK